jgi:hypothetical protein
MINMATSQIVVCAAVRSKKTGTIVCGPRHGDCINSMVNSGADTNPSIETWEMGFVDQDNNFMTRAEAWTVADKNGQIRRPTTFERDYSQHRKPNVGDEGILFSENLY